MALPGVAFDKINHFIYYAIFNPLLKKQQWLLREKQ